MNLALVLGPKSFGLGNSILAKLDLGHVAVLPQLAGFHVTGCLETSHFANGNTNNFYSVAVCLVRQCVEALALVDLGLQPPDFSRPRLERWEKGQLSHGELRATLDKKVWPRYGHGLWTERWTEFFGNLARAVQPYAHYTYDLLGWQIKVVHYSGGSSFLANLAPRAHDPIRAARVAILQAVVTWTLARLLIANRPNDAAQLLEEAEELRAALAASKLLVAGKEWGMQLMPHVLYGPGASSRDE
jgi:hypothetical protein